MGFVTNGEHDQMMRDQQRDLRRIADALENANHLKWLELYMSSCECKFKEKDALTIRNTLAKISNDYGWGTVKD